MQKGVELDASKENKLCIENNNQITLLQEEENKTMTYYNPDKDNQIQASFDWSSKDIVNNIERCMSPNSSKTLEML
ncbi:37208_t:CDS:1, partial [Gigaspora margarita]